MGFETGITLSPQSTLNSFQSSFSEYGLWNGGEKVSLIKTPEAFQSSFSEYGLWNLYTTVVECKYEHLSILVFWVWALKHLQRCPCGEPFQAFNPRFLSMGFETLLLISGLLLWTSLSILVFWVWALKRGIGSCILGWLGYLSILVFWVWALKQYFSYLGRWEWNLSILVFWVWALKQVIKWRMLLK